MKVLLYDVVLFIDGFGEKDTIEGDERTELFKRSLASGKESRQVDMGKSRASEEDNAVHRSTEDTRKSKHCAQVMDSDEELEHLVSHCI